MPTRLALTAIVVILAVLAAACGQDDGVAVLQGEGLDGDAATPTPTPEPEPVESAPPEATATPMPAVEPAEPSTGPSTVPTEWPTAARTLVPLTFDGVVATGPVSPDVPAPGAGMLEPFEVDVYTFEADADRRLAVEIIDCDPDELLAAEVLDSADEELSRIVIGEGTCIDNVQVFTTERAGRHRIEVSGSPDGASGPVTFQLLDVTDPEPFPISVGDRLEPGVPLVGAGVIEGPALRDVYSLELEAGRTLIVEGIDCAIERNGLLVAELIDRRDDDLVRLVLGDDTCIDNVIRFDVEESGSYLLYVSGSGDTGVGTYTVQFSDVTDPPPVTLTVGETVGPDTPVAGAGIIEGNGWRDVYAIELAAGDVIGIDVLGCDVGDAVFTWELFDPRGQDVDRGVFSEGTCVDNGERVEIDETGVHTLIVEANGFLGSGTYELQIVAGG